MNWRSGLQLRDHDPALRVELSCPPGGCGRTVRPTIADIIERAALKGIEAPEQLWLDEVADRLNCRGCGRKLVMLQTHEEYMEAFQGGMP